MRSALTAFFVVHVRVELLPDAIEVGFATMPAAGGPLLAFTVTVVWAVAVPPDELVAMNVYVVVALGETVWVPLTATATPFKVALTAFVDAQVRVALPPVGIDAGSTVIPAVGSVDPTVTVA